jgi:hypothetical protein
MHLSLTSPQVGALSTLTRQTNIIWMAFVVAVSVIRDLKEAHIIELKEEEKSPVPRAWFLFDPLAADAQFPGTLSCTRNF